VISCPSVPMWLDVFVIYCWKVWHRV